MAMIYITDANGNRYSIDGNKSIGNGGEGTVYPLGNGMAAKLYHNPSDAISPQKIKELSVLDGNFFVKPLVSVSGDKAGYLMQELDLSEYFPLYSLYSSSFASKNGFPTGYKKGISEKLVKAVRNAHDNGIVIGDLNPFNIMANNKLDVKFIDVDSYETASCPHNDKLLEDIRDYYYNGRVSKDSDYFALSVVVFCLFTGIHPYKGIHNIYRDKLKDREVNNVSLLNEREFPNIKVPKFYVPVDDSLKPMFYDIYQSNKRFLISMDGKTVSEVKFNASVLSDELVISNIFSGNIGNVVYSEKYVAIFTGNETQLYSMEGKGIVIRMGTIDKKYPPILTGKHIYTLYNGQLHLYDGKSHSFNAIQSLIFNGVHVAKQYENILVVVTKDDKRYTIYLDEVFAGSVRYAVDDVFHKSVKKVNGMFQPVSASSSVVFYSRNGQLLSCIVPERLTDIIQNRDTGIYTVLENNKVVHKLFHINSYGLLKTTKVDEVYPYTSNDKFIILYADDKLHFLDKETLIEVVSFSTKGLDNNQIGMTQAGILTFNNVNCCILNTK